VFDSDWLWNSAHVIEHDRARKTIPEIFSRFDLIRQKKSAAMI
jgi:hypothetical protein